VFQLDEFVLDAEFLAFQAGEGGVVGVGAVDFSFDLDFEAAVTGTEFLDLICHRHGSSWWMR
jgi:hypothetical protein